MARNLAEKLESMSGYRHAFPLHSPQAHLNPVNYSHLLVRVGGRRYHVLSRIANAGPDYTQRSNILAHHVALDDSELISSGPASVLATPGFCETAWDGPPQILPAGRQPKGIPVPIGDCGSWKAAAGDAGWAGVVAEHVLKNAKQPISVIFPPEIDTFRLLVEVFGLLPQERHWNVTFSTYYTKLPAGFECQLRFILDGTKEAVALRRRPHDAVIDLSSALGSAEGSKLVEVARTGGLPAPRGVRLQSPPGGRRPGQRQTSPIAGAAPGPGLVQPATTNSAKQQNEDETYQLTGLGSAPPVQPSPARKRIDGNRMRGEREDGNRSSKPKRARVLLIVSLILGLFLLLSVGGVSIWLLYTYLRLQQHVAQDETRTSEDGETDNLKKMKRPDHPSDKPRKNEKKPNSLARKGASDVRPAGGESSREKTRPTETQQANKRTTGRSQGNGKKKPGKSSKDTPKRQGPFDDIIKLGNRLNLSIPVGESKPGGGQKQEPKTEPLVKIYLQPKQALRVNIEGGSALLPEDVMFKVNPVDSKPPSAWDVVKVGKGTLSGRVKIGRFEMVDDDLTFKWDSLIRNDRDDHLFRYSLLKLSVGRETVTCTLSRPETVDAVKLRFDPNTAAFKVPIKIPEVLKKQGVREHLRLQVLGLALAGDTKKKTPTDPDQRLSLRRACSFSFPMGATWKSKIGPPEIKAICTLSFGDEDGLYLSGTVMAKAITVEVNTVELSGFKINDGPSEKWSKPDFRDKLSPVLFKRDVARNLIPIKKGMIKEKELIAAMAGNREELRRQLDEIKRMHKLAETIGKTYRSQLTFLSDTVDALKDGTMMFRLYLDVNGHEVEVLTTSKKRKPRF
jgi:hypothetical protein